MSFSLLSIFSVVHMLCYRRISWEIHRDSVLIGNKKRTGQAVILTEAKLAEIRNILLRSPSKSLRDHQISFGSAQKAGQTKVCNILVQSFVANRGIVALNRVLFTDDEWFHLSRYVHSQNTRIWSTENPHIFHESPLYCQKISVV